ncbi:MAG TPA: transposase [Candidatus Saccharimonadia bacterium]|nr:transposase [Candidatus Saccharimonadia bacterium]
MAAVNRVMANYPKDPDSLNVPSPLRGRPSSSVDVAHQEAMRAYIRQANLEGRPIPLDTIRDFLQGKSPDESFHLSTRARTGDRWGFEFGKGTRTQHLKEKDSLVVARQHSLRKMRQNRMASDSRLMRPEVYLDESSINKNHSNDFVWYASEDGPWIQKPTGKGERLILMHAISKDGWVPEATVVLKSTRKTGDYHGQMNGDVFQKWFREKLLPNIPRASLIIMDNASSHTRLAEDSAPTPPCSKAKIRSWLEANNSPCKDDCLTVALIDIGRKRAPEPTSTIDVIARQHGHEVIRTPPYHPELQPIETCWGILKNEVARHCDFTLDNLKRQLEHAFDKITATTCQGIIDKVRSVEDRFWEEDAKLDEQQEHPIS